jgi:hypothetical protein
MGSLLGDGGSKRFFFEKKNQKTFVWLARFSGLGIFVVGGGWHCNG